MRVATVIAYNGKNYFGSQIQKETANTIFGKVDAALCVLGITSQVVASGRTDKGVHATGQVVHFDLPEYWSDLHRLTQQLNRTLPSSILIKKITPVSKEFHARYNAKKRVYRYILKEGTANPFEDDFVTFTQQKLNIKLLREKMALFEGEHDFQNFRKTGSDEKSTIRTIYKAFAYKHKEYIILHFEANGFLRSQIRMMVGSLLMLDKEQILEKLNNKDHKVKPAPPNGLYLAKIKY